MWLWCNQAYVSTILEQYKEQLLYQTCWKEILYYSKFKYDTILHCITQ